MRSNMVTVARFIGSFLVTGIVAASVCFFEIITLAIRYLIYKLTKEVQQLKLLACGVAIKGWKFIKGVCQSIMSNGLGTCFSLLGGAIGMLIPIPVINLIMSVMFSAAGFMLGKYVAGVPVNFYRRYKCLQNTKKRKAQKAIQQWIF